MTNDAEARRIAEGLTGPQKALLEELPTTCTEYYPPARKLLDLGLAVVIDGRFGDRLYPTLEGKSVRAILSEKRREG